MIRGSWADTALFWGLQASLKSCLLSSAFKRRIQAQINGLHMASRRCGANCWWRARKLFWTQAALTYPLQIPMFCVIYGHSNQLNRETTWSFFYSVKRWNSQGWNLWEILKWMHWPTKAHCKLWDSRAKLIGQIHRLNKALTLTKTVDMCPIPPIVQK